ncbi:MAG TPA: cation-transporting P-type ATPase, partial [Thermodesulfobacteriota bacterium]|nr:cation-transporting P-type ATPase [Thermodesulfobacteriota bacterium]
MNTVGEPWKISEEDVLTGLGVSPEVGLSNALARERLSAFGPNRLAVAKPVSALSILIAQFRSLIVLLLIAAALLSFFFDDRPEGFAIVAVIVLNAAIGFFTELRAVRSMETLHSLVRVDATVLREGSVSVIRAEELVPGDIVVLEAGDMAPADLRL